MSSSIKSGLKALQEGVQGLFVALATSYNQVYAGMSLAVISHHGLKTKCSFVAHCIEILE